jgi:hydrogenase-1 operon protein HyaF
MQIPVRAVPMFGPGSQAGDGPDYLSLPTEMAVFRQPDLPQDPALQAIGREWLARLASALESHRDADPVGAIDLAAAGPEVRRFLDEVLGHGEVSAAVIDEAGLQIEESVFPGLWRVRGAAASGAVDRLEVGDIPQVLVQRARAAARALDLPQRDAIPAGVVNAPHVLAELIARSRAFDVGGEGHVINLDLVPMDEAELGWLVETLGEGPVVIVSSGYGACRIRSTRLASAWWVQYFNSSDVLILNSLEIAAVPPVACAADDDIAESARRLRALQSVYA